MASPTGRVQLPPAYQRHLNLIQHSQSDKTDGIVVVKPKENSHLSPKFCAKLAKVGNAMRNFIGKIKKTYGPLTGKVGRLRNPRLGKRKTPQGATPDKAKDIIQVMLTDPRDRTVQPKNVISPLINDGYTFKKNGKEINDYLINNPNSSLFSSENITFDGFQISLKQAVHIPGMPSATDQLILADRNKSFGELNPMLAMARAKNAANVISPLLNNGYAFQNNAIEINDFLIKNPQNSLFSNDDVTVTGYQISFKQPEEIPGTSIIIDKLIIDIRDNNNGEFRGAPALDLLKTESFNSLAHLCAIMTFSDRLNVVKMRTARIIADQLNNPAERQRLVVPQNAEAINSLVKYNADSDRYESRFMYSAFNPQPKGPKALIGPDGSAKAATPIAGEPHTPALDIAATAPLSAANSLNSLMSASVMVKPALPPRPQWIAAAQASRTKAAGFVTLSPTAAPDASSATPFTPPDGTGKTVLGATEGVQKLRNLFEKPGRGV